MSIAPTLPGRPARSSAAVMDVIDTVAVIAVPGRWFSGRKADDFAASLRTLDARPLCLVLDLSDVEVVDAVGLRALAGIARDYRERGGEVAFCGAARPVRHLMAAAGLHDLAEVYQTRNHAIAALNQI